MSTFFTPGPGRLLLEPITDTEPILIINDKELRPKKGKVLSVGTAFTTQFNAFIKPPCKVGDIVSHETIGYETITYKHKEYHIVPFLNIIGVWTKIN